jgi:hypothetical protein
MTIRLASPALIPYSRAMTSVFFTPTLSCDSAAPALSLAGPLRRLALGLLLRFAR